MHIYIKPFARFSNRLVLNAVCLFFMVAIFPCLVKAQDYVPPPMFGAQDLSPAVDEEPKKPIETPKQTLEQTNTPALPPPPLPRVKPVLEAKQEKATGVVKGPKTMPAVPAQTFDAEVIYENRDGQVEGAILRRHQLEKTQERAKESSVLEAAPQGAQTERLALDIYDLADGKARKITLPYSKGQENAQQDILKSLQVETQSILKQNPEWRLQIQAFASPYDEGQSSDRRMALTRALAIRQTLLESGIEPRAMDVRALGSQTSDPQKDRVDIILYAPGTAL